MIITTAPRTTVAPKNKSSTEKTTTLTPSLETNPVKSDDIVTNPKLPQATHTQDLSLESRFEMLIKKLSW